MDTVNYTHIWSKRQYELTNHTGNVLATITDRKIPHDVDSDTLVDYYTADIITADDYYPFGMEMPGRRWRADSGDLYQFGFQGMLKDNLWQGNGNMYNTRFRQYHPRLGRWLSPDPIKHPWQGSYTAFNNNPIYFVDPMGLEGEENGGGNGQPPANELRTVVVEERMAIARGTRQIMRMFYQQSLKAQRQASETLNNMSEVVQEMTQIPQNFFYGGSNGARTGGLRKADPDRPINIIDFGKDGEGMEVINALGYAMPSGKPGSGGRPKTSQHINNTSPRERGATARSKAAEVADQRKTSESLSKSKRRETGTYKAIIDDTIYYKWEFTKGPAGYKRFSEYRNRTTRFINPSKEKLEMLKKADWTPYNFGSGGK